MNTVRNYQKELDRLLEKIGAADECAPTLFLHSCCAPCSSYVLEYLRRYFRITVFYFNPNITEDAEYRKRVAEQKRLIAAYNEELTKKVNKDFDSIVMTDAGAVHGADRQHAESESAAYRIDVIEGDYEPQRFFEMAKGLEQCQEGGERCFACYALRLSETAKLAQEGRYDYFATTLSISPLKNAVKLNEIGEKLAQEYGVAWLPSDFKKKDGYKRSIELSKEYGLYRQDYCGCVYSRMERERQRQEREGKEADGENS
ncbi:MAG: epoxyqueuosine reductase QueH [Lachnospiraceae bacterium]|nr:epoxyqueuosine reductase QueH [Lachnospiraceae bacterium]